MNLSQIILRPVLTEKSVQSEQQNKYAFVVHEDATKVDVKRALKMLYSVHAVRVNILRSLPKYRLGRARMPMQKRAASRRAIITLKKGEKLDLTKMKTEKKEKTEKAGKAEKNKKTAKAPK